MRFAWLGILFHGTILLWLFEERRPTYLRSAACRTSQETSRLLLFVIPGLGSEHRGLLKEIRGAHLWVTARPSSTAEISLVSGIPEAVVLPLALDSIFEHVNATFFAGSRSETRSSNWTEIEQPYYMRVMGAKGERSEIDMMEDLIMKKAYSNAKLRTQIRNSKVIFYLRFDRLYNSKHIPNKIHRAVDDVIAFTKAVNAYYDDNLTNAVLWGEQTGPMVIWGPSVVNVFSGKVNVHDLTPMLAALLNVEVPGDSLGILPAGILKYPKARARAAFCNAQQLGDLQNSLRSRVLQTVSESDSWKFFKDLKLCDNYLQKNLFERALNCSARLCERALTTCEGVFAFEWRISSVGNGLAIFAWMSLLFSEIAAQSCDVTRPPQWYLYVDIFFLAVFATNVTVVAVLGWRQFKLFYFAASFVMLWTFSRRFHVWYPALKLVTITKAFDAMFFCTLFSIASIHALASVTSVWMSFGVSVLAQLLVLPRYSLSPALVTYAWWSLCLFLLLFISLSPCDSPSTKLVDFGGTLWLCLTGFASFWVRPVKDIALCASLTLAVSCAMLFQNTAIASTKFNDVSYGGFLFFLTPLLPLIGEPKKTNRIIHVGASCAVAIILTSPCIEALSYLVCLLIAFLWSVLEEYKCGCQLFSLETCRRGIFLCILLVSSDRVTTIIPFVDTRFPDKSVFFIVSLYRQVLVLGSLLTIFFVLMPIKQARIAFTLTQFIVAIASIRTAFFPVDRWQIHQFGIALVLAYYFARVFGKIDAPAKSDQFPRPDVIARPIF